MASKRTSGRFFFHRDHLLIVIGAFILLGVLSVVTYNISFLNPVAKALKAFSVTDLFFDIQHYGRSEESGTVAIVDISDIEDRGDIAVLLNVSSCAIPPASGWMPSSKGSDRILRAMPGFWTWSVHTETIWSSLVN